MIKLLFSIFIAAVIVAVFLVSVIDGSTDKGDLVLIVVAVIAVTVVGFFNKKGG